MLFTKNGLPITFTTEPDAQIDKRGWKVDDIKAFVEGREAGYLRISYIPQASFDKVYPSIFHWMDRISGIGLFPFDQKTISYTELSEDKKRKFITRLRHEYIMQDENLETSARTLRPEDLDEKIAEIEKKLLEGKYTEHLRKFTAFKTFHVDKPMVDFIRVYTPKTLPKGSKAKDYQRQGIGTALYQAGAQYAHSKNMKLWASGLQQKNAKLAWENMDKMGWVKHVGKRRYLEHTLIDLYQNQAA